MSSHERTYCKGCIALEAAVDDWRREAQRQRAAVVDLKQDLDAARSYVTTLEGRNGWSGNERPPKPPFWVQFRQAAFVAVLFGFYSFAVYTAATCGGSP